MISLWVRVKIPDNGSTTRAIAGKRDGTSGFSITHTATTGALVAGIRDGSANVASASSAIDYGDAAWHDVMIALDAGTAVHIYTEQGTASAAATAVGDITSAAVFSLGSMTGYINAIAGLQFSYAAFWSGTFLSSANFTTLITSF